MSWSAYLALGRVSNLPTVWTNVLAGMVLAGAPVGAPTIVALLLAMSLFYVGGMYLNDAFDREIDARERPERPIPSGRITANEVYMIGFGMLGLALGILGAAALAGSQSPAWRPLAAGAGLAGLITYYDWSHKRDPLSPVVMGLCRVMIYVTVALAVAGRVQRPVLGGAAVLLCYLIGLTYVAKQETLTAVRNLWPLVFLAAPFLYGFPVFATGAAGAVIYLAFLGWVVYAVGLVRFGGPAIGRAVVSLIAGISLLDALLIARAGASELAGWCVAGFALTVFSQRWVRGT